MKEPTPISIAFFDLDRTLTTIDTFLLFGIYLQKKWKYRRLRTMLWSFFRFVLGKITNHTLKELVLDELKGLSEDEAKLLFESFYREIVTPLLDPTIVALVRQHQEQGELVVLASASYTWLLEYVAADLELEAVIGSDIETVEQDGIKRVTGKLLGKNCFGQAKLEQAAAFCSQYGVELSHCSFYSDSSSDLPLLRAVGTAKVVRPTSKLQKVAKKSGWEICRSQKTQKQSFFTSLRRIQQQ